MVRVFGRGRRSGAMVMARVAHLMTFTDGRVASFTEFKEVDEGLEAAGLSK